MLPLSIHQSAGATAGGHQFWNSKIMRLVSLLPVYVSVPEVMKTPRPSQNLRRRWPSIPFVHKTVTGCFILTV